MTPPTTNDLTSNADFFASHEQHANLVDAIVTNATAHGFCVRHNIAGNAGGSRGKGWHRYVVLRPGFTSHTIRSRELLAYWEAPYSRNFKPTVRMEERCLESMYAYVSERALCTSCGALIELARPWTHDLACPFYAEPVVSVEDDDPPDRAMLEETGFAMIELEPEPQEVIMPVGDALARAMQEDAYATPESEPEPEPHEEPALAYLPELGEDDWDDLFPED